MFSKAPVDTFETAYTRYVDLCPPASAKEHEQLLERIRGQPDCPRLRNELIRINLRLVFHLVQQTLRRRSHPLFDDCVAAGNIALTRAAHRAEPRSHGEMLRYLSRYIRRGITDELARQNSNGLKPDNMRTLWRIRHFEQSQPEASNATIARTLKLSITRVRALRQTHRPYSLQEPCPTTGNSMEDILGQESQQAQSAETHNIARLIDLLPPKRAQILRAHYGIGRTGGLKFVEIAKEMGLSRERIRQLHDKALVQLREVARTGQPPKRSAGAASRCSR